MAILASSVALLVASSCSGDGEAERPDDREVEITASPEPASATDGEASVDTSTQPAGVSVDRVIDGDSLELVIDGAMVEVRLLGINAPELAGLDDVESCNGVAARDHLRRLVDGARSIEFVAGERDRFGRVLGTLLLDGVPVTTTLVEAGWALALWSAEDPSLTELMIGAAADEEGMWGDGCGSPNTSDLAIADWRMDPPGDDRDNLADEWVVVANEGATPIDLDGWTIRDETTTNRFLVVGAVLPPGEELRFRSGPGTNGGGDYYLGGEFPVWSNRGETILLLDPEGRVAAHAFVDG